MVYCEANGLLLADIAAKLYGTPAITLVVWNLPTYCSVHAPIITETVPSVGAVPSESMHGVLLQSSRAQQLRRATRQIEWV